MRPQPTPSAPATALLPRALPRRETPPVRPEHAQSPHRWAGLTYSLVRRQAALSLGWGLHLLS